MQCLSCKTKLSTERCEKIVANRCIFCPVHMRSRSIRMWSEHNPSIRQTIIKFQALWRGYQIRYRLRLAGKGSIRRSICHNDDEMVTGDSKTDIHPFDYFSIEEDGKVWWFDQKSMIQWAQKTLSVSNPFTRKKLSPSDMNRLHELTFLRKKTRQPIVHSHEVEHPTIEYLRDQRWLRVVQKMREHSVAEDVHPNHFGDVDYDQFVVFLNSLIEDTRWWTFENAKRKDVKSKRSTIFSALRRYKSVMTIHVDLARISHDVAGILILGLFEIKDSLEFVVMILTAATRSGVLAADL